jgi:hypothetical protein
MRQVKFECSEEFYQRLNTEKLRRNLTLQQLAIRSLEWYCALPESLHRQVGEIIISRHELQQIMRRAFEAESVREIHIHCGDPERARQALELSKLMEMIEMHLDHFPLEKLRLLQQSLALDLKYYKSARIKTDIKPLHINDLKTSPATVAPSEDYAADRKSKGDD